MQSLVVVRHHDNGHHITQQDLGHLQSTLWWRLTTHGVSKCVCLSQGGCDIVIGLLQRCAFAPLGGHVNKVPPLGRPPALRATLSSEEESVVALLEGPLAKLHWSTALCILR